jgi:integrase/recombinase XerC
MVKVQKNKCRDDLCLQKIELFIHHLQVERNYAGNTISAYRRDLGKFLGFCQARKIAQWRDIDAKMLNLFVMTLRHANTSNSSIRRHLSSIRGFFSFLLRLGVLSENCAQGITSPKLEQTLPKTIDFEELCKMMQVRSTRFDELRNVAMIELIYSCALRVSELVGININDMDFKEGFVKVMGKGSKARFVPVGQGAIAAINRYLSKRPVCESNALFINQQQNRIGVRSVQNIIKQRALDVGITFNVHPHMLRHAAATHFLQSSHDLRSVQEFLGHKSIKSTQVYTHLDFLELSKVYDDCHPRAKK